MNSNRPIVDVGVVTWNTADLTVEALRSLLDSEQDCDVRVLVHDNASSDGTVDALARWVPEAEVEAGAQNLGFARAMNRLIRRSTSPWFLALNSDAWPEAGALGALVRTAELHPNCAAVAPLLLRPDGTIEHSTHPFPSLGVALLDATGGRNWMPRRRLEQLALEGAWRHDYPREVDWAVGAALLMRRQAIESAGDFDERFFMYVEDLEWCWRARRAGWSVRFEPSAIVRHVGNASGEKRFGGRRAALEAANLHLLLPEVMGPRGARAYRALQALASAERAGLTGLAGRKEAERAWKLQILTHLGLDEPPLLVALEEEPAEPCNGVGAEDASSEGVRVAVVVPTCDRSHRLPRLIDALESQTLRRDFFEVVLVNDGSSDDTEEVAQKLAADAGISVKVLRNERRMGPAAARNTGWRSSSAHVIAFTDDDCVPCPRWLEEGLRSMGAEPRVVVGRTEPPFDQRHLLRRPFARFVEVDSPKFLETCNVFYRRRDLEAVGGFDERFRRPSGEDTHLALAVLARGVTPEFAPAALVHHDVRAGSLREALSESLRWADLPLVVRGRPGARRELAHRFFFWKDTHPPAILAGLGLVLGLRWRLMLLLVLPWMNHRLRITKVCDEDLRNIVLLPGALALDLCEVATMARGSWRHRTLLL